MNGGVFRGEGQVWADKTGLARVVAIVRNDQE